MEVIRAIADPIRREILSLLRTGPRTAGAIAAEFRISRPAVSRHLRILREAGLVRDEPRGRERVYRLDLAPLAPLDAWLAELRGEGRWSGRLDALETEVYRARRDHRRAPDTTSDRSDRSDTSDPHDTQEKLA